MIARHWRGLAKPQHALIEFLIVTHWASLEAIRAFAGDDIEAAVVRHFEVVG